MYFDLWVETNKVVQTIGNVISGYTLSYIMEAILPWFVIGSTDQAEYFLGVAVRVIEGLFDILKFGFRISDFWIEFVVDCSCVRNCKTWI